MPDYLAPAVEIDETGLRNEAIAPAPTSSAAFVGPTASGAVRGRPQALTSFAAFESAYGSPDDLALGADPRLNRNHVALAARAYFDNGGRRLYVARVASRRGRLPSRAAYAAALRRLERVEEVSTVAAPGSSARYLRDRDVWSAIQQALIDHAARPGACRFAVLDSPPGLTADEIGRLRAEFDGASAALYYPWIVVADPRTGATPGEVATPPSGAVCGIYARTDASAGVANAPANALVAGALRAEREIGIAEQVVLNPLGINCLRSYPGRGLLVWGARTLATDPEWKYVNVRRYANYLEASIERGTRWAAFEPNAEPLWAAVARSVTDFLYGEWRGGALRGDKPEEAFFVRCDRSTMTQDDIDRGRLVCLIGTAVVRPAEFLIVRIGQWAGGSCPGAACP